MGKMKIKKGDTVRVITGKDKGKEGKVLSTSPSTSRVVVEGINMVTKHVRAQGANQGGIVHQEAPIHVSNVMLLVNGKPTRVGIKIEEKTKGGKTVKVKSRIAKATGEVID